MEYYVAVKKKELTFCDSMDGPGDYYAKWSELASEEQIPSDLMYMWNLMNKTNTNKIEMRTDNQTDWQLSGWEGKLGTGGKKVKGLAKNVHAWPMDTDNTEVMAWGKKGWGLGGVGQRGKNGDNVLVYKIKIKFKN